jgi:hypothetical protein
MFRRIASVLLQAVLTMAVLVACGGGDSGPPPPQNPAWISLDTVEGATPAGAQAYTTDAGSVSLAGTAFISPGWWHCCSGMASDTGVTVNWANAATASSANAFQRAVEDPLFGLTQNQWSATIPLAMGSNAISVTASDPAGYTATDAITVTRAADITPPSVTANTSAAGATSVALNTVITVTFSEALDPATLNTTNVRLMDGAGNPIAGTVTYWNLVATFIPASSLAPSTVYTVSVGTGVKDLAGNPLSASFSWSFTT